MLAPLRPPAPLHSPQTPEKKPIRSASVHAAWCAVIMVRDCDTLACCSAISGLFLLERYCISLKNSRSLLPSLSLSVCRCVIERRSGGKSCHHRFEYLTLCPTEKDLNDSFESKGLTRHHTDSDGRNFRNNNNNNNNNIV